MISGIFWRSSQVNVRAIFFMALVVFPSLAFAQPTSQSRFRVVLVAATKYFGGLNSMPGLEHALPAMQNALMYLAKRGGFRTDQIEITVHSDAPSLTNMKMASDAEIIRSITQYANQSNTGDVLVFFFTGHGVSAPGGRIFLYTSGGDDQIKANRIDLRDQIIDVIRQKSRASVNLVLIDACQVPTSGDSLAPNAPLISTKADLDSLRFQGIATFLASREGERAYVDSKLKYGFFTASLVDAFQDERIGTAEALASSVSSNVAEMVQKAFATQRRSQNPVLAIELSTGGSYSLIPIKTLISPQDATIRNPTETGIDRCRPQKDSIDSSIFTNNVLELDLVRNIALPPLCSLTSVSVGNASSGTTSANGLTLTYEPAGEGIAEIPIVISTRWGSKDESWQLRWRVATRRANPISNLPVR